MIILTGVSVSLGRSVSTLSDGETIYDEYAGRKGYGPHHLAIRTNNMEQSIERMEGNSFKVIQSGGRPGAK